MKFLDIYPLILVVLFTFLLGWLLPKSGKTYDVFKLRLDLFPQWFKWVGGIWIFVTLLIALFLLRFDESQNYFLLSNLNFSLFIILFSSEKNEDEFSEQVRLKAFIYSFISFVAVLIIYGAIHGSKLFTPVIFNELVFVHIFLGIALLTALTYFYITKYRSNKK